MKKISQPPPPSSERSRALAPGRDKLLYVEDEDQNWLAAEIRLRRSYDVIRAKSDREACEELIRHGETLAAVLMDIQLRGSVLDGINLTMLLRGKLDRTVLPSFAANVPVLEVPVVFVSAYGARYSESALIAAGGNKMIAKPVDFVELTSTLAQIRLQRVMGKPPSSKRPSA
jgi:CheY-like chemotaxis protein